MDLHRDDAPHIDAFVLLRVVDGLDAVEEKLDALALAIRELLCRELKGKELRPDQFYKDFDRCAGEGGDIGIAFPVDGLVDEVAADFFAGG